MPTVTGKPDYLSSADVIVNPAKHASFIVQLEIGWSSNPSVDLAETFRTSRTDLDRIVQPGGMID